MIDRFQELNKVKRNNKYVRQMFVKLNKMLSLQKF